MMMKEMIGSELSIGFFWNEFSCFWLCSTTDCAEKARIITNNYLCVSVSFVLFAVNVVIIDSQFVTFSHESLQGAATFRGRAKSMLQSNRTRNTTPYIVAFLPMLLFQ